ncbi:MAG: aldo/keto reductase, partial [Acidobacteriota bacterium]
MSLGSWGHSGPKEVAGRPVGWSGSDDDAASQALIEAYSSGITHWDTADVYGDGRAEKLMGSIWSTVPRDEIFLATKVGWDPGRFGHFYHPEQIRSQLEKSLRNLATDHLDLYYFHHCDFGSNERYLDDALETVRRAREAGKIRFIGLSDWDSAKIARLVERVDPDVIQPYRNVLDDGYATSDLKTWVQTNDVGVAFFSPIKHGLLLGKHTGPVEFGPGDHRSRNPSFRDARLIEHLRLCREQAQQRFAEHA